MAEEEEIIETHKLALEVSVIFHFHLISPKSHMTKPGRYPAWGPVWVTPCGYVLYACLPVSSPLGWHMLLCVHPVFLLQAIWRNRYESDSVTWEYHTLAISTLSCVIMRNIPASWWTRKRKRCLPWPRKTDGFLCLEKNDKSARQWMSWEKGNLTSLW